MNVIVQDYIYGKRPVFQLLLESSDGHIVNETTLNTFVTIN